MGGISQTYVAHEATAAEYDHFWATAEATYIGFPRYKERAGRLIPIMVLEPAPAASDTL